MQVNITPTGFPGSPIAEMAERYGIRRAQQIEQDGLKIEGALQRMTTSRQLQGLTQTLSQLNPESPDYPQQVMAIAGTGQFQEALRDPRGQMFVAMGGAAHQRWQQSQQAIAQSNLTYRRQLGLEGVRSANDLAIARERNKGRLNTDVDLSGVDFSNSPILNPGRGGLGSGMRFGAGMPQLSGQSTATGGEPVAGGDETGTPLGLPSTLGGFGGGLGNQSLLGRGRTPGAEVALNAPDDDLPPGSSANRAAIRDKEGSLLGRALGPLKAAQQATGIPASKSQVFAAVAAQRQRDQQAETQQGVQGRAKDRMAFDKEKTAFSQEMQNERLAISKQGQRLRQIQLLTTKAKTALKNAKERVAAEVKTLNRLDQSLEPGQFKLQQERVVQAGAARDAAEAKLDEVLAASIEDEEETDPDAPTTPAGTPSTTPSTSLPRWNFDPERGLIR